MAIDYQLTDDDATKFLLTPEELKELNRDGFKLRKALAAQHLKTLRVEQEGFLRGLRNDAVYKKLVADHEAAKAAIEKAEKDARDAAAAAAEARATPSAAVSAE